VLLQIGQPLEVPTEHALAPPPPKVAPLSCRGLEFEYGVLFGMQGARDVACLAICVPRFLWQSFADSGKRGQPPHQHWGNVHLGAGFHGHGAAVEVGMRTADRPPSEAIVDYMLQGE
jgi:hypothetical protein